MTFIFSSMYTDLCVRTHTHVHILVCQILLSMPGNMCSHRMERSHLHPPCIFSPGSKLLGNEFQREGGGGWRERETLLEPRPAWLSMKLLVRSIHTAEMFPSEFNLNCV